MNRICVISLLFILSLLSACGGGIKGEEEVKIIGLTVGKDTYTLPTTTRFHFTPLVKYSDGTIEPYTGKVYWKSGNNDAAGLYSDDIGLITTGTREQTTKIRMTAVDEDIDGYFTIKVQPMQLDNLTVVSSNGRFNVTGHYKNNLDFNLSADFEFFSSDASVFSVDEDGSKIKITGDGKASLVLIKASTTRYWENYSTEFEISVNGGVLNVGEQLLVKSLLVSTGASEVPAGVPTYATVIAEYTKGGSRDVTSFVRWNESSGINVGSFDEDKGWPLTGILEDKQSIDLAFGRNAGGLNTTSIALTVTPEILQSIHLVSPTAKWAQGEEIQLQATGRYSLTGDKDITSDVTWLFSNDTAAALVDGEPGKVKALAPVETLTVQASLGSVDSDTLEVNISEPVLRSVTVSPLPDGLRVGKQQQMTATAHYTDSDVDVTATARWEVDNAAATISETGLLTGVAEGFVYVTAYVNGTAVGDSTQVEIRPELPVSLELSTQRGTNRVNLGYTLQLVVEGIYADSSRKVLTDRMNWQRSNVDTATISAEGLLSTKSIGTVDVFADFEGVTSNTLTITVDPPVLTQLDVMPTSSKVPVGSNTDVTVSAVGSDGEPYAGTLNLIWQSSDASVAEVTGSGSGYLLSAKAEGQAEIRVSSGGITSATITITVVQAGGVFVLDPMALNLIESEGATLKLTYINSAGDLEAVPADAVCVSSDTSVATTVRDTDMTFFTPVCRVSAVGQGKAVISVSGGTGTTSSETPVTVSSVPVIGDVSTGAHKFSLTSSQMGYNSGFTGIIDGLTRGERYTVKITPKSGSVLDIYSELWIAPSADRDDPERCAALLALNRNSLACTQIIPIGDSPSSPGQLYLTILDRSGGVPFDVEVFQGGFVNQGESGAVVLVMSDTRDAEVSSNAAWGDSYSQYSISNLEAKSSYRVSLMNSSETVQMVARLHTPLGISDECIKPAVDDLVDYTPGVTLSCDFTTNGGDANGVMTGHYISIKVYGYRKNDEILGASATGGASYMLTVQKN